MAASNLAPMASEWVKRCAAKGTTKQVARGTRTVMKARALSWLVRLEDGVS